MLLATVTAERDGNRDTLKAANDLSEERERDYHAERAAHAETRKALEELQQYVKAHADEFWPSYVHGVTMPPRTAAKELRAELAKAEARVKTALDVWASGNAKVECITEEDWERIGEALGDD